MKKTAKTIDSYLNNIIQETVRSTLRKRLLHEQDDAPAIDPAKPGEDEEEKLKKGEITSDDIIEKLNAIRAGKSFKDQQISSSLESYVNEMSKAEKTALFAFLKGISQIVTGEIAPAQAMDPSEDVAGIEMKKVSGAEKIVIKPTMKKPGETKASKEDTSGPVPIKPKSK
jgi:hypothetical protein